MLFDSHAHYNDERFKDDVDDYNSFDGYRNKIVR